MNKTRIYLVLIVLSMLLLAIVQLVQFAKRWTQPVVEEGAPAHLTTPFPYVEGHLSGVQVRVPANFMRGVQADDHQRIMVAQNLVNIGVREVSFHPISESSVGVVNSKGITVGHLEKKSDGSIRYADNNENGFEISVSGRSQHVLRGRSEDERHLADQVKPDIDSFRAHHRVVRR